MSPQDLRREADKLLGNEVLNTNLSLEDLVAAENLAKHILLECTRLRITVEGGTPPLRTWGK
jgi:hypothetical protein